MAIVFGEAYLDEAMQRYYYQIEADSGQVLARSDPVFMSSAEAAAELILVLRGLAKESEAMIENLRRTTLSPEIGGGRR